MNILCIKYIVHRRSLLLLSQIYYSIKAQLPVYTDPICLLYRVFHETQTAMAMAVVVTMVATVVGAVVHAVKVRISVPSLFCIPERVLYFISKIPISKFTFIHQIFFINHTTLHLIFVYVLPSSFPFIFFLKYVCTCTCEHMKFYIYSYDTNKNKFSAVMDIYY